jgi:hypothetical protein
VPGPERKRKTDKRLFGTTGRNRSSAKDVKIVGTNKISHLKQTTWLFNMCKTNCFLGTNKHQFDPKRGTNTQLLVERTEVVRAAAAAGRGLHKIP